MATYKYTFAPQASNPTKTLRTLWRKKPDATFEEVTVEHFTSDMESRTDEWESTNGVPPPIDIGGLVAKLASSNYRLVTVAEKKQNTVLRSCQRITRCGGHHHGAGIGRYCGLIHGA